MKKLLFFVLKLNSNASTQILFKDSIENSFTLSFDSWSIDRKTIDTQLKYQVDIDSAQNINCPKYLVVHQIVARKGVPNKAKNFAVFENLDIKKYHIVINGVKYPRDSIFMFSSSNDYVDQYRGPK